MSPVLRRSGVAAEDLLRLDDVRDAVGITEPMGTTVDEVPLGSIVGTAARADDYDGSFAPVAPDARWHDAERRLRAGEQPPPVDLVRLGDLYFVHDGHRRVSVARAAGWTVLPARVTRFCTVAFARCCLRAAHLDTVTAERRFLDRVPLPDDVRADLWLDRPADWARLADQARAWGLENLPTGADPHDLACAWWEREVLPVLERLRADGAGTGLRDVQLYVTALAARDRLGALDWPEALRVTSCC